MSPVKVLLHLISFSRAYFALCVAWAIFIFVLLPVPLGLATAAFFDALAGVPAGLNVWTAIAFLVAIEIATGVSAPVGNPWDSMQQKSTRLLRRNLFAGSCADTVVWSA